VYRSIEPPAPSPQKPPPPKKKKKKRGGGKGEKPNRAISDQTEDITHMVWYRGIRALELVLDEKEKQQCESRKGCRTRWNR